MLPLSWLEPPECHPPECKKLLLVSDPQIIGFEWKLFLFVDYLAIWDSDRYLKRTFSTAVNYIRPDIIIFLGDLMDLGHVATEPLFQSYFNRFKNIFDLPSSFKGTKIIITPGDNDVGGIEDILVPENVDRFNQVFNQTEESILIDFVEFCKVNLMTSRFQQSQFINEDIIRVVLTHVPLTPKESFFLKEVVKKIRPHLILSGHFHTSYHYTTYESDVWSHRHRGITPDDNEMQTFKFHEGLIHEIIVPTCSYRMGVTNMGYGAAYINSKKKLIYYNVLWLPQRFFQLFIYSLILSPFVLFLLLSICRRIKRSKHQYTRNLGKMYAFP